MAANLRVVLVSVMLLMALVCPALARIYVLDDAADADDDNDDDLTMTTTTTTSRSSNNSSSANYRGTRKYKDTLEDLRKGHQGFESRRTAPRRASSNPPVPVHPPQTSTTSSTTTEPPITSTTISPDSLEDEDDEDDSFGQDLVTTTTTSSSTTIREGELNPPPRPHYEVHEYDYQTTGDDVIDGYVRQTLGGGSDNNNNHQEESGRRGLLINDLGYHHQQHQGGASAGQGLEGNNYGGSRQRLTGQDHDLNYGGTSSQTLMDHDQVHNYGGTSSQTLMDQNQDHNYAGSSQTLMDHGHNYGTGKSQIFMDHDKDHNYGGSSSQTLMNQDQVHNYGGTNSQTLMNHDQDHNYGGTSSQTLMDHDKDHDYGVSRQTLMDQGHNYGSGSSQTLTDHNQDHNYGGTRSQTLMDQDHSYVGSSQSRDHDDDVRSSALVYPSYSYQMVPGEAQLTPAASSTAVAFVAPPPEARSQLPSQDDGEVEEERVSSSAVDNRIDNDFSSHFRPSMIKFTLEDRMVPPPGAYFGGGLDGLEPSSSSGGERRGREVDLQTERSLAPEFWRNGYGADASDDSGVGTSRNPIRFSADNHVGGTEAKATTQAQGPAFSSWVSSHHSVTKKEHDPDVIKGPLKTLQGDGPRPTINEVAIVTSTTRKPRPPTTTSTTTTSTTTPAPVAVPPLKKTTTRPTEALDDQFSMSSTVHGSIKFAPSEDQQPHQHQQQVQVLLVTPQPTPQQLILHPRPRLLPLPPPPHHHQHHPKNVIYGSPLRPLLDQSPTTSYQHHHHSPVHHFQVLDQQSGSPPPIDSTLKTLLLKRERGGSSGVAGPYHQHLHPAGGGTGFRPPHVRVSPVQRTVALWAKR